MGLAREGDMGSEKRRSQTKSVNMVIIVAGNKHTHIFAYLPIFFLLLTFFVENSKSRVNEISARY
jgi:hypothetical protein